MADDPNKQDNRDRSRVAGDEDYEVRHFAEQNAVSADQARELIRNHGNDREAMEREARRMRSSRPGRLPCFARNCSLYFSYRAPSGEEDPAGYVVRFLGKCLYLSRWAAW